MNEDIERSVIRNYDVMQPPTSGEVADAAYDALRWEMGRVCLELMSQQKVPPPESFEECLGVHTIRHNQETGDVWIVGRKHSDGLSMQVCTYQDRERPATARGIVHHDYDEIAKPENGDDADGTRDS